MESDEPAPSAFATEDYLRAIGQQVKAIRSATNIVALIALVQLALLAAWILGIITIEFRPDTGF